MHWQGCSRRAHCERDETARGLRSVQMEAAMNARESEPEVSFHCNGEKRVEHAKSRATQRIYTREARLHQSRRDRHLTSLVLLKRETEEPRHLNLLNRKCKSSVLLTHSRRLSMTFRMTRMLTPAKFLVSDAQR